MENLADEFVKLVRSEAMDATSENTDNSVCVIVAGNNGTAEVQFGKDDIIGTIEGEFYHSWIMFPNMVDIRSGVRKIHEFIG